MRPRPLCGWTTLLLAGLLVGCADSTAPAVSGKADAAAPAVSDAAADLATAEASARAFAGLTGMVAATAEAFGEIGSAVGDLVPSEDNPCPGGGEADGRISGSLRHPEVRMSFENCVRGPYILSGVAHLVCDDFDGSSCHSGEATLGEDGNAFYFSGPARNLRLRGTAYLRFDEGAHSLQADTSLIGELRTVEDAPVYAFRTEHLVIGVREVTDAQAELRLEGVTAFGGGEDCVSGRFDTETLQPLLVESENILGGELRLHSPPPRPGVQQALARYGAGGANIQGADGVETQYPADTLAGYCTQPWASEGE